MTKEYLTGVKSDAKLKG